MEMLGQRCIMWGETPYTFEDTLKWIEKAGRTCYNSLDKMTETSYKKFTYDKTRSAHLSIIEHSNKVLRTANKPKYPNKLREILKSVIYSPYIRVSVIDGHVYVAGNYRGFLEDLLQTANNEDIMFDVNMDDLLLFFDTLSVRVLDKFNKLDTFINLNEPDDVPNKLKRITFEFITDRSVTHELVRHRRASFSQRSQRYVRENNLQVITPYWFSEVGADIQSKVIVHMLKVEELYTFLFNKENGAGLKAEAARAVLPNMTMTILVMTASVNQWKWIRKLRDHQAAYPPARDLAHEVGVLMSNKGWL